MDYLIRKANDNDAEAVMTIMNYYINNSLAAYFEQELPLPAFQALIKSGGNYPFLVITSEDNEVVGYGFVRRHHPAPAFDRVAELAYFIMPDHTRKGLGLELLNALIVGAKNEGVSILLANINSLNQPSIDFHLAQGFREVGRFIGIGHKFGQDFDVVWMQRLI